MKKIFLSLALLLSFTGAVFAQTSMLATLSHEGEITVFYGADALKDAHAAAQHGDAITLSSGSFKATNITKAITLRGAGMEVDTLKNTYPTIICGDFSILIGDSVSKKLTIEGIYSNDVITISNGLNNATFIKNRLGLFQYGTAAGDTIQYENNRFIHCKITNYSGPQTVEMSSATFSNCYIKLSFNGNCNSIFTNCIVNKNNDAVNNQLSEFKYCAFYNCIFIAYNNSSTFSYSAANIISSSNELYNCIVTNSNSDNSSKNSIYYTLRNIPNDTNKVIRLLSSVFKSFNGTYTDLQDFELVNDIKTSFKGTDGTQVGIHGGSLPFSPATTNPQITKCNVASRSTADGKLSVDIEVTCGE